ncbi:hypothetical protein NCCP133_25940 [Cytobacillus sp. NCCP-133]|nr:hypothetical protein NCCP133_25940 [Cytobacillus sp. NCCP-133]
MLETWLKESGYTVILTGAGMLTESGLPNFRYANKGSVINKMLTIAMLFTFFLL